MTDRQNWNRKTWTKPDTDRVTQIVLFLKIILQSGFSLPAHMMLNNTSSAQMMSLNVYIQIQALIKGTPIFFRKRDVYVPLGKQSDIKLVIKVWRKHRWSVAFESGCVEPLKRSLESSDQIYHGQVGTKVTVQAEFKEAQKIELRLRNYKRRRKDVSLFISAVVLVVP